MTRATDETLREKARRLAGTILLERSKVGPSRARGSSKLRRRQADHGGDLDIDASLEAIVEARAAGLVPHLEDLQAVDWAQPGIALCLLVDTSGSMTGGRLAAAALTAAACAWRAPEEFAVVSFEREATVRRGLHQPQPPELLVDQLLALRGHGVTGLSAAMRAAADQLVGARSTRRVTVLLSDCRATDDQDPVAPAAALDELLILAPADDADDAYALAAATGARVETMTSAADAPAALGRLLDP
jgi:Mg-chelatase subunit ChlD